MSNPKDASGLTKQERHDLIINYLKEINKPTKVFHLRWRPGDLLNGKIMRATPMFWYMKYQWSREQIEGMFFKARVEIDAQFDASLQQVFGGSAGPRWRGGVEIPKQKKWKLRAEENARAWQGQQADKVVSKENVNKAVGDYNQNNTAQTDNRMKNKLAQNIGTKNKEIWNAISDFGADKSIDYKTFSDNLKDRGINVSPLLAKQLFDQLAGPSGKINKQEMDSIVRQLDRVKLPQNFANISWDDMGGKLGAQLVMKRVLLAASTGEPFNVDDFVFASKFGVTITPVQFMNKLTDRDVEWDDRVRSMEAVSANLGTNPMFNNLLANTNIPELLCGWCTQMLDNKPEVQKTAVELMPNIFHECLERGDPQITVGHLEEILDNLFKVLDDPKCSRNHPAAKDAIAKVVDDVIAMKDPESVLYLAGILAEKCDLENISSAPARAFALEQIQKIMFGPDAPQIGTQPAKATTEWGDIAAKNQPGPSKNMYSEPTEEYWGDEANAQQGRTYRPQERRHDEKEPYKTGAGPEEFMEGFPLDPAGPYAHVTSFPTNAMPNQNVKFDATKSHDCDHQPCKNFLWDFGDGSPQVTTTKPVAQHSYKKPQVYPVTVTVTDKYGKKSQAGLNQRINDPKHPLPPYAQLDSDPPTQHVNKPVKFDASKSHDGDKKPCVSYCFDFGDDTPKVTTPKPVVMHPFAVRGSYPVKVTVTDRTGQTADAFLTQRITDPNAQDPTLPYAAVSSTPKDPKPSEPVKFDASKSVDCDGDPVKNYVWDFGDFSPPVTTTKPVVNHAFNKPGTYPVKLTVTDKYGKPAKASCKTMVVPGTNPANNSAQSIAPRLPPTVVLKSNPQESIPTQPVYFDASDSHDMNGNPCVQFVWDFGDDTPKQTTKEPATQHPYEKSGTYTVSVVATDKMRQKGDATCNQRVREPDPEAPYAAVKSTPTNPEPGKPVRIDASESVDLKGNPCKNFVFDFGDGSPPVKSTNPVVNHVYTEPGTYPVTCTVVDKYGKKGNAALNQRIKDPKNPIGPPYAMLESKPKETYPYEPVDFDASKSHDAQNMPCKSFVWNFGDGSPAQKTNGPYAQHKYEKPGQYPVSVEVEDKRGQKANAMVNQRVGPDPDYNHYSNEPNVRGTKPAYANTSWDPIDKYGNKAPVRGSRPARTGLIERHMPPYVGVRSTPTNAKPNEKVLLDASDSQDYTGDPPVEYHWDFGDGTPVVKTQKPKVEHAYNKPGTFPVKCTVVDKFGQKGDAGLTQRVKAPYNDVGPPYAVLSSAPKQSTVAQPVEFDASDSHDAEEKPCVKFVWDFGDGSPKQTSDVPRVKHPYQKTGTYPVTVVVTDKRGKTGNASVNQPVTEDIPPYQGNRDIPNEEMKEETGMRGINYRQQQHAAKTGPKYFSGGGPDEKMSGDATEPAKTGCVAYYNPIDPYASVRSTPTNAKPKQKVRFDASDSQDADGDPPLEYQWNFGDGTPVVKTNKPFAEHAYDKPGSFPAKCTVIDKNGNPAHASCTQRVVNPQNPKAGPPYAAVTSTPKEPLQYEPVTFDASKSHDADQQPCVKYKWDFGDGTPMVETRTPQTQHAYDEPGTYPVAVTVVDKNGQEAPASCSQRVTVEPPFTRLDNDPLSPPIARLESNPKTATPNQPVTFDASQSHDMDKKPCVKFEWDFGDGSPNKTSTTPQIQHAYQRLGHYPATVTVTDSHGQRAKAHTNTEVTDSDPAKTSRIDAIRPPTAVLESDKMETLPNEAITFDASKSKDMYGKPCVSYVWDFGDNSPQKTTKTPTTQYSYRNTGDYPVTVAVKDRNGLQGKASVNQRVSQSIPARAYTEWDPINSFQSISPVQKTSPAYASFIDKISPPFAALEGTPKVSIPRENVDFDASRSCDAMQQPCVEFTFDFGDGTMNVTQNSPYIKHKYQKIGNYPVTVTVKDKNGLKAKAHCNQKVTDSDPARNNRTDQIQAPYANVIGNPPQTRPNDPVEFDASKSVDMYSKPCVSYQWDFGDGTPKQTTKTPVTTHPYKDIGNYPVTVTVTDKNGLKANASCNEKVSENIPPYSGNKNVPNPMPDFNRNDNEELKDEPPFNRMDPEEIGDEFRGITSDAISKALMDPNRQNAKKAKRIADQMKTLNPQWPDDELDPEAKKRYKKMGFPQRPFAPKKLPPKPFVPKAGKAVVNEVDMGMTVNFGSFEVPDI